jgi:hypothetical protein
MRRSEGENERAASRKKQGSVKSSMKTKKLFVNEASPQTNRIKKRESKSMASRAKPQRKAEALNCQFFLRVFATLRENRV